MSKMKTQNDPPTSGSENAVDIPQSACMDRRILHIQTLYEATRELSGTTTPLETLRTFLPIAMGPLGLTFGFGVMRRGLAVHVESLGLGTATKDQFTEQAEALIDKFFPHGEQNSSISSPTLLAGSHLSHSADVPADTGAIAVIPLDKDGHVVLGFGPKLTGEPLADDETDLLNGLVITLSTALKKACGEQDIKARNRRLRTALEQTQEARVALDRRAFQLHTLYEATLELSGLHEPVAVCDAFLLILMGTFSYTSGWAALYGPNDARADVAHRGLEPDGLDRLLSREGRDMVLGRFVELKDRMPHQGQSALIDDETSRASLPLAADVAIVFTLDNDWRGAVGLSAPLTEGDLSTEMEQLLLSLVSTFMVTLGNAKHIQLIQDLNSDLAARNVDLQNTLDALTSARNEISLLTEAKEAIVGLVRGELERVRRPAWLDVLLIILAGIVLGGLFNYSSPSGIDLVPHSFLGTPPETVAAEGVLSLASEGAVIVDARPAEFYQQKHIKGAISLPKDMFGFVYSMKLSELDPAIPLVVYGRNISRHYDVDVARELSGLGHENVFVFEGGVDVWEEAGYEVNQ